MGHAASARYCYSVWLRHLVNANAVGLQNVPETVAELGPGDSLGVGIAALLSGVHTYYALDVVTYEGVEQNLALLEEIAELFRARAPIPNDDDFASLKPALDSYAFPAFLNTAKLDEALSGERIERIRHALNWAPVDGGPSIAYQVPWTDLSVIEPGVVDMVFSQAVLEHVDDLPETYQAMYAWLKPGGIMSHQIDFKSHGFAREWNGHWRYSDRSWRMLHGGRPWTINRAPVSAHVTEAEHAGMEVVNEQRVQRSSEIARSQLADSFATLSDADLGTAGVFLQARKPA